MSNKHGYLVGEEVVATLPEVAQLLGVEKVSMKDVLEGGKFADDVAIIDVDVEDDKAALEDKGTSDPDGGLEDSGEAVEGTEPESQLQQPEEGDEGDKGSEDEDSDKWDAPQRTVPEDEEDTEILTPEEMAENLPTFDTIEELKEFIKDIDTPTLEYIAKSLGLEWKPTDHASIYRMRVAMSLHHHFFPETAPKKSEDKKKKAKYGDFTDQQLFQLAKENKVRWKRSGNAPIDRMRVIMALKEHEVLPE